MSSISSSHLQKAVALSIALLTLQGCVATAAVGAGTAARVVSDERSVGVIVDDVTIANRIREAYFRKDVNNLYHKIGVKVTEGRALLNGTVDSVDYRLQAVQMAWEQKGVKEVINEISVSDAKEEGISAIPRVGKDSWITTQIKSKLFLAKDIHSVNFSIETIHGRVYVMGIATTQAELDTVLDIARSVKGVQKVISHVRVKQ